MSVARYCWLSTQLFCCLLAATPAHEAGSDDLEHNRQLLKKWQVDPEHSARLQRDLRDYWALPASKRERLRLLDKELHQLDEKTQKRLWKALERYSVWLEQLPENERKEIETASDAQERLRRIKEIRARERERRRLWQRPIKQPARPPEGRGKSEM